MSAGVSGAAAATMLDALGDPYLCMHFDDPGATGTANIAFVSTRMLADLGPASATTATRTLVAPVEWSVAWSGGAQTVGYLSAWTAATAGTFLFSVALSSQVDFVNGMVPRLTTLSVVVPSLATD